MVATNPILSRRKCPACYECGDCISAFVIDTDCTIPAIDGSWDTCRANALAAWATLSDTPTSINGVQQVFATEAYSAPGGGGCSWQAAQYAVVDPAGHRGRSWVVDLWLHDDAANTTVRYSSGRVTDWVCTCNGPRFSWTLPEVTDLGCFGRTGDACEDCTGKCLRVTLPALASNPFSPDCGPHPTETQDVDVIFGVPKTVTAAGTAPDVTTWSIEAECSGDDSQITLTYDCPTKDPTEIVAVYRRSGDCFGTYTRVSGDTTYLPASLTVKDCCATGTGLVCTDCDGVCVSVAVPEFASTPSGWSCDTPTASDVEATWVGPSANVVFSDFVNSPDLVVGSVGWRYRYSIRCISGTNKMRIAINWLCYEGTKPSIIATYDGPAGSCAGTFSLVAETGGGVGWAPATITVTAC